jgi:chromosome partitioning protein
MAYVISVANNKGGTGKTTTAINIVSGLCHVVDSNPQVLLIDADAQGTASDWRNVRPDEPHPFQFIAMRAPTIHSELPAIIRAGNYNYVVIDCPPGGVQEGQKMARSAIWASDMVIIPAAPSGFDFWASDPMSRLLEELRTVKPIEVRLLINRKVCNTRLGRAAREGAGAYAGDIPIFHTEITQRASIVEATTNGFAIFEFEPGGIAAWEYSRLIEEILECEKQRHSLSQTA